MAEIITTAQTETGITYDSYRKLIDKLFAEGRTTGDYQDNSAEILEYTRINIARMNRGDRTFKLDDALKAKLDGVDFKMLWLVLTEGWCGDAAQTLPALVQIAEASPNIEIKFLLRDENLDLMDAHLTNGGRSIPKLIALNAETLEELGSWGPRPVAAQELINEAKALGKEYADYVEDLHKWYAKDRYKSVQQEMLEMVSKWS